MKENTLSVKALALTVGIFWGAGVFLVGVFNLIAPTYGLTFLWFVSSIYPGYKADPTIVSVLIGTVYAFLDGLLGGAVFAWLYNALISIGKKGS